MGAIQNADGTTASCEVTGCGWSHWVPASWAGLASVAERITVQKRDAARAHAALTEHVNTTHAEPWPRPARARAEVDPADHEWESYCGACGQGYDGDDHVCDLGWHYGPRTPVDEPIEIRLERGSTSLPWVLVGHVANGRVWTTLTAGGHGTPHAFSSLQCRGSIPAKAVPGWQAELLATVGTSLYTITEVR